jgi:hypothetical protein
MISNGKRRPGRFAGSARMQRERFAKVNTQRRGAIDIVCGANC